MGQQKANLPEFFLCFHTKKREKNIPIDHSFRLFEKQIYFHQNFYVLNDIKLDELQFKIVMDKQKNGPASQKYSHFLCFSAKQILFQWNNSITKTQQVENSSYIEHNAQ